MSKKFDSEITNVVNSYLVKQNRPYSLIDIFTNLHNKHGKTAIQKALDQLVSEKKVCEKSYGKQKVYVTNQELMVSVSDAELHSMNSNIAELNTELNASTKTLKDAEVELTRLNSSLTTDDALRQIKDLENELEVARKRLNILASNPNMVSSEDKKIITSTRESHVKEWKKRKRCADDILNGILESYPKSKKALFEEIGVETDDDIGVKIPV